MTTLSEEVRTRLEVTLDHFNGDHADTMLLLARFAAGCPEADDAEAISVDVDGIDFAVRTRDGDRTVRARFPEPVTTMPEIQACFLDTITEARDRAGDLMAITSLERELANQRSLPTHVSEIADVRRITPDLMEIRLVGGLDDFRSAGGDQFVYLMVPRSPDHPIPDDHTMAAQMEADPDTAPLGAYYTVRRWEPEHGRLTIWVVLHGHDDSVGGWAQECASGERVAIWGPRAGMGVRDHARRHLFVADETGIAAVAALLDELPTDVVGHLVAETVDVDHVVELPERPGVAVTWVFRGDDEPGVTNRLLDAVVALDIEPEGLVAFGAAESRQITAIRTHVRHSVGMSAQDVHMTGYWRRDVS